MALSGGTDSTLLVSFAAGVSGLRVMAVTVRTPYMFSTEVKEAAMFCKSVGVEHREIVMDMPLTVTSNPPDRCYLCKREVMKAVTETAREGGFAFVFDGTNNDDLKDYRPGMKALREMNVRSPLAEAGLTKAEIRELAREARLDVSDKPSNSCLLTRFPHDTVMTPENLRMAEAAELIVTEMGFPGTRVRIHGELVRIECRGEHFAGILKEEVREKISSALKKLGYKYITIDAEGYRSGSMNKTV
ncbi:MAG: ATP-dependent sacrificial sulfur transferase LarE [Bacteroidales bacterium]|nr:ATP-dependent sacrificial sulfur transferase LarE [Bacteroidales bacterium]